MTPIARIGLATLALAAVSSLESPARAQTAQGFSLDRFNPSERGSEWFVGDTLDLRGHGRPALGIVGDFAARPLVLYNSDGTPRSVPVRYQFFVHVGGAINLWDRVRIGVDVPVAIYQDGDGGTVAGTTYAGVQSGGIGDLRVSADVRLLGQYGDMFTLAAGVQAFLPTGDRAAYLGDGSVRFIPRVLAAGDIGVFVYSANIGFQYRGLDDTFAGSPRGSELVGAITAGVRVLDKKLVVGPEVYGATVVTSSDAFGALKTTPLEGLFGAHYSFGGRWRAGAGVATGLNRGFGEPRVRYVFSLEYVPGIEAPPPPPPKDEPPPEKKPEPVVVVPPSDRDGDGIVDVDDACPDVKGVKTDDPKTNGCPPPPPDRDGDGIIDAEDACPDVKGIKTSDPKTNGCPPDPDRDKDGIPNDDDACPDAAGPKDPDPKKNGCPAAAVVGNQIKILDQVKFATASAVILKESEVILNAVLKVLMDHSEIKKVRVEGHTDNVGPAGYNKMLSQQRAASVVTWLVKHGIDKDRLTSAGFGMERPIDSNAAEPGRKNNRRVEFHIEMEERK